MGTPFCDLLETLHAMSFAILTKRYLPSSIVFCEIHASIFKERTVTTDSNNSLAFAFNCKHVHSLRQSGYIPIFSPIDWLTITQYVGLHFCSINMPEWQYESQSVYIFFNFLSFLLTSIKDPLLSLYTHICRIKGCGGAGWPPHQ